MTSARFDRDAVSRPITITGDQRVLFLTIEDAKRLRLELDMAIVEAMQPPPWKIAEVRLLGSLFHAVVRNDTLNHYDSIVTGAAAMFWIPRDAAEYLAKKNAEGTKNTEGTNG